jgi:hypothetical protein
MHTLQDEMLIHGNAFSPVLCWSTPGEEHDAVRADLGHCIDDLLGQQLPALSGVRVGVTSTDSQTCVQKQDATIRPWGQEAALVWWGLVVGVVDLECLVDVLEGRRGGCRWTNGEAEAMCLVGAVVGVLTGDDNLDCVEGCMPRPVVRVSCNSMHDCSMNGGLPRIHILHRRIHSLSTLQLLLQEFLQL